MELKDSSDQLARIYEKYSDMVYRIAYSHSPDAETAGDISQDVFLKLVENYEKLQSDEHIKHWLIRVTINCCNKSHTHKTNHVVYNDELLKDDERDDSSTVESSESLLLKKEKISSVREALLHLTPEEYRIILYLFYYEQFSISEIAKAMKLTKGAAKTKLFRARASMEKILMRTIGRECYES